MECEMKYATSEQLKSICPSSVVQEVYLPSYEIELDFVNNNDEQNKFFAKHEQELVVEEVITFTFNNPYFAHAGMVSIIPSTAQVKYQVSIVFAYSHWHENKPLHKFIVSFLRSCNNKKIDLVIEGEDSYGYYLLASFDNPATSLIKSRIEQFSKQLAELMDKLK